MHHSILLFVLGASNVLAKPLDLTLGSDALNGIAGTLKSTGSNGDSTGTSYFPASGRFNTKQVTNNRFSNSTSSNDGSSNSRSNTAGSSSSSFSSSLSGNTNSGNNNDPYSSDSFGDSGYGANGVSPSDSWGNADPYDSSDSFGSYSSPYGSSDPYSSNNGGSTYNNLFDDLDSGNRNSGYDSSGYGSSGYGSSGYGSGNGRSSGFDDFDSFNSPTNNTNIYGNNTVNSWDTYTGYDDGNWGGGGGGGSYGSGSDVTLDCPVCNWVGYPISLFGVNTLDVQSVMGAVIKSERLMTYNNDTHKTMITRGTWWKTPTNVEVEADVSVMTSRVNLFNDGKSIINSLTFGGSLAGSAKVVKGDASADYALRTAFSDNFRYAVYQAQSRALLISLNDYKRHFDESIFKTFIKHGLQKFDPSQPAIIQSYQRLFQSIGTHVIVGAEYGSRMSLTVWATNKGNSTMTEFQSQLGARFSGLFGAVANSIPGSSGPGVGISASAKGKNVNTVKTTSSTMQKICSCVGGDPDMASRIQNNPTEKNIVSDVANWQRSAMARPALTGLSTVSLPDLLYDADDDEVRGYSDSVSEAYDYLIRNPIWYRTEVRATVNVPFAKISLLSPSSFIEADPALPPPEGTVFATSNIQWAQDPNKPWTPNTEINFVIVSHGDPINLSLWHSSTNAEPGSDTIQVTFAGNSYSDNQLGENDVHFLNCPVDTSHPSDQRNSGPRVSQFANFLDSKVPAGRNVSGVFSTTV